MSRRTHILILVITALTLAGGTGTATAASTKKAPAAKKGAKPDPAVVASSFDTFCEEWMHKLQERQRDNISHIKWEHGADGVDGSYVGYEEKHTCKLIEGTEDDPVAKVFYREIHYTQHGATVTEAEQSTPKATEIFEVQEIFHYLKGKWDY